MATPQDKRQDDERQRDPSQQREENPSASQAGNRGGLRSERGSSGQQADSDALSSGPAASDDRSDQASPDGERGGDSIRGTQRDLDDAGSTGGTPRR